jgi:molybdenum ABC transporter molybdate-binding protein
MKAISSPLPRQSGRIQGAWLAFLASVALLCALATWLMLHARRELTAPNAPLVVFCAAGIKTPVEILAADYTRAYGVPVQLQYGGSQTLLATLGIAKRGDLFLPGDESYARAAREKGQVAEIIPVAKMTAVLAVRKGNPKHIRSLDDLQRPEVAISQAMPQTAAIGKMVRAALEKSGQWEAIAKKTKVFKPTVNDVANDVKLGSADAGFIWDAMLPQYPNLEAVPVPALQSVIAQVSVSVLQASKQPTAALRFARFLAASDHGQAEFARNGFSQVPGDPWADTPVMTLFAGAMLRPAIDDTINQFEQREGVRVNRVYNGCGILVAQMKTGQRPDAYFACDKSFMSQVSDLYVGPEDISSNPMIILTQKGNPKSIKEVKDLGAPGLRVGLAHEQQSALGALTKRMLQAHGLYDAIRANVKVESATGDYLVNQLRAGALDATIVYVSNGAMVKDQTESLPIALPEAFAIQPIAVGKEARYPRLAERLHEAIRESKESFTKLGFGWQLGTTNQAK